jgi:retron-type reverse transcriptase
MIEQVLNPNNIMRAYRQVKKNDGSAGVDRIKVKELYNYLKNNRERIETEIREGKYMPQPILGVESSEARS